MIEKMSKVFLVDDDKDLRDATRQWLELSGYEVDAFSDAPAALASLKADMDVVIVTDVKMPQMDGMAFLQRLTALDRDLPVVLISAHGDVQMAVEAMRQGAYDFIEKPFAPEQLLDLLLRASEKRRLVIENRALRHQLSASSDISRKLIGNSEAMQRLRAEILDVASTDAPVLIVGETGTGKEVVAQCLHECGHRSSGKFVPVHCGAIPEGMVESELFGHERGAFTGADRRRIGRFEYAQGGSLLLDEIGTMPLAAQVKLLRTLQEKEVVRVGSNEPQPIDIRLISATNSDLQSECADGNFREDLYYRINVIELKVPPLRERDNDVYLLFDYFASLAAKAYSKAVEPLPADDISLLLNHNWPGNVRELKNVAERYVLSSLPLNERLASLIGTVTETFRGQQELASLNDKLRNYERCILEQCLAKHQGDIQSVMEELGLPRRTLNEKMSRYGLERKQFSS
jgi:two-component system C4-dicarboxylate transport response regulator DctD